MEVWGFGGLGFRGSLPGFRASGALFSLTTPRDFSRRCCDKEEDGEREEEHDDEDDDDDDDDDGYLDGDSGDASYYSR